MDQAMEKLLSEDEHPDEEFPTQPIILQRTSRGGYSRSTSNISLALVLFLVVEALLLYFFASTSQVNSCRTQGSRYPVSPADEALSFHAQYFLKFGYQTSPFAAPPGPIVDEAWHSLLKGMNIRVPKAFLDPYNATSVEVDDGSGDAIAQLGMYHELHCLKKIKHWIYRSHYLSDLSSTQFKQAHAHIEHCLDWLRVAALCRGDTTLTTLRWNSNDGLDGNTPHLDSEYPIPRQCVDVEKLLAWSEERAVDVSGMSAEQRA